MTKHRLPDDQYKKLMFHTRTEFRKVLNVFTEGVHYGQDIYVDGVVESLLLITEEAFDVVRGDDKPISLELIRKKKGRKK